MNGSWCVYMLRCKDNSFYTGISNDLIERIAKHKSGKGSKYVRSRLPVVLCYVENCSSRKTALVREHKIKNLKRDKKLELVDGNNIES